ncbi:MAG: hypothetical protein V1787_02050 [Candidatus Micrarchaeota archaeon]
MMLDATTYKTVLTPEAALGIIQKELAKKGWKKPEVEDVRLVYTPFYLFSFDVAAEGAPPITGKAALNAFSGEINEIVPMILERPLTRMKEIREGEVEETAITPTEARDAALAKLAVQTGVKKEMIAVSAFSKSYVPFYRVWVNVHREPYKAEVDALMGSMVGLEGVHEKPKSWGEAANDTINKMKTPSGWAELGGKTIKTITGGGGRGGSRDERAGGHTGSEFALGGSPFTKITGTREGRWLILLVAIIVLAWLFLYQQQGSAQCKGDIFQTGGQCVLEGDCGFNNGAKQAEYVTTRIMIYQDGQERLDLGEIVGMQVDAGGKADVWRKQFNVTWNRSGVDCGAFSWKSDKV